MKQNLRLLLLMLLCAVVTGAWGQTSFSPNDFSGQGTANTGSQISATKSGVTFACDKGYGTTQIRCYKNGTITISSTSTITALSFEFSGTYTGGLETSYTNLSTNEWSTTLESQARFMSITVTTGSTSSVSAPTISPNGGSFTNSQEVTISAADGAIIYYTMDGNDPTTSSTEYTAPFTVSETTTVKAIAVKNGESSSVAEAKFTKLSPVADFATLPFEFDGGRADIENTDGLTQEGLETDYSASPKLKFNSTGDYVLLHFDGRPGVLTFDIKGNTFSDGTFTVQTSEDGETFTNLETYTELGSTQSEEFNNLGENVRYIKWIYTNKTNGNVALGNIMLKEYVEPTKYVLTIADVENATITASGIDGNEITSGSEILAGTKINLTIDVAEGYILDDLSVTKADGNEISVTKNDDSWSFTMPSSNVTVTCTLTEPAVTTDNIYAKVTSNTDLTSGTYLIVYENESLAFNGALDKLDVSGNNITVTISDNKIQGTEEIDAATFTIDVEEGTIQNKSGLYIGSTEDVNKLLTSSETAYTNTLSIDDEGNAEIVASSGTHLRFNPSSNNGKWFRYFKSASYQNQKAIQLYKLEPITLTISSVGYATLYYSDKNLVVPTGVEAYTYKLNDAGDDVVISNTLKEKDVIPAGCGVVLKATGGTYEFVENVGAVDAIQDNLLLGFDDGGDTVGPEGVECYFYMLSTDKNGEVGFYWGNSTGAAFNSGAHKAYLAIPKSSGINISAFSFEDLNGIRSVVDDNAASAEDVYTLSGIRMNGKQLPKGIYIVNGKKVVIK